jgi:dihydrofolate reductase
MHLSIIVAVSENGVIGRDGGLPWHLSADLQRFKRLTMGHTIVMGRRTWESIGRVLPGRTMIVVSRQAGYEVPLEGVRVANSLESALQIAAAAGEDEIFIVGGAELYREALPQADRLYLTRVHAQVAGDTQFPAYNQSQWQLVSTEQFVADAKNEYPFSLEVYQRV